MLYLNVVLLLLFLIHWFVVVLIKVLDLRLHRLLLVLGDSAGRAAYALGLLGHILRVRLLILAVLGIQGEVIVGAATFCQSL